MDGFQFTADLFKSLVSLAWPAAFVVAVWLFREKLTELMPLLRLKYKDLDVSFRLDQAEKDASQLPAPAEPPVLPTPEESSRFDKLAQISPRAAILEMRTDLEEAITMAYRLADPVNSYNGATLQIMIRALRQNKNIDEKTAAVLDDLRAIGNRAAHASPSETFTVEDAQRFRKLVERVKIQFGKGPDEPEPIA